MTETTIMEWARTFGVPAKQINDFLAEQGLLPPADGQPLSAAAIQALQLRFAPNSAARAARSSTATAVGKPVGLHGVGKRAVAAHPSRPVARRSPLQGVTAAPSEAAPLTPKDTPASAASPTSARTSATTAAAAGQSRKTPSRRNTSTAAPASVQPKAGQPAANPSRGDIPVAPVSPGETATPTPVTPVSETPAQAQLAGEAAAAPDVSSPATVTAPAAPAPLAPSTRAVPGQTRAAVKAPAKVATSPASKQTTRPKTAAPSATPGRAARTAQVQTRGQTQRRPLAHPGLHPQGGRHTPAATPAAPPVTARAKTVEIGEQITVKDLAQQLGKPVSDVIKELMKAGLMATVNQSIDQETAALVAQEFGAEVKLKETAHLAEIEDQPDPAESLKPRPPVVTIMGHVDHGKTTLLDAIRESHVAASEAGGITQHIGAYQAEINGKKITFLDTPGHEAFTAMRARGAQVTDIAVLVVAADDGVMPQTVEAIHHAQAAGVPIVVAINKIDKPGANPERVKQQLTEYGLVAEEWGGDTVFVPVSALRKTGLDELLEMILLTAELRELKANPDRPARGVVIEAQLDRGRGPVATVLVQKGTLRVGDLVVAGATMGKVRALFNEKGKRMSRCGPSTPALLVGLSEVPTAGDEFVVVEDERLARQVVAARVEKQRREELQPQHSVTLEGLYEKIQQGETKELNLIIKADVQGSVEALRQALGGLQVEGVRVSIIHAAVGGITESDVHLAEASKAIIIGFNVRPDATGAKAAEQAQVDVRLYQIIYDVIADVEAALKGMLAPKMEENTLGRAEVRQTFHIPKVGEIAGCVVLSGRIPRSAMVRILRDSKVIYEGRIASLKRFKDDVREVTEGYECGVGVEKFNDIKEGDILEAYRIEAVPASTS
ncbi:MAG: translation initiation factor IF-2 [Limnochordaceae bacterium]|nr:translation initiation factor IF-2 [Limnochordaceae bacterium]